MTQNQQAQTVAYCKIIILAAKELLDMATKLNDCDVDTSILLAESVKEIATGNSRIIDHIHGITNSLDVEVLKAGNPLPPTLAAYANIEEEINDYIPQ